MMKKKVKVSKVRKDFLKTKEELHERIEKKQDRKKLPMPSKKKAMKEAMEGEEVLHEYLEEKLHGKGGAMPKAMYGGKEAAKHKGKKPKKERSIEIEIEIEHKGKKKPDPKPAKKGGKMAKVMKEFSKGELHSGSKKGPMVTNPKQAVAIGYAESKRSKKKGK